MAAMQNMMKAFLTAPKYAVVGASKDQSKFGTKVLKWYLARNKDVTPIHPREDELEGVAVLRSLADLPDPLHTSVSVITPPQVTLGILEQAKALSIPTVWLQPGAADESVADYIKGNDLTDKVIYGGPCILRDGDSVLKSLL